MAGKQTFLPRRKKYPIWLFFFGMAYLLIPPVQAQHVDPTASPADTASSPDLVDKVLEVLELRLNRRVVARDTSVYPTKLVLSPVVYYTPETNWGGGVGAKLLFKFPGAGRHTRTSNMPMSVIYTLNNQFILYSGYTIFFNHENYLLKGNLRYSQFPQLYYGIGNNTPSSFEEEYAFHSLLVEPLLLKKIHKKWFAGGGFRYNHVYNTELQEDGRLVSDSVSGANGFTAAGLELALTYDNRDNVLNAFHGVLAEVTYGMYGKVAGGTHAFQLTKADVRYYIKPFRKRNDVLAFQALARFSHGDVPLLELPALGGEYTMRGYYEGRYRDRHFMAVQAEYRMSFSPRLGAVAFVGFGSVADKLANFSVGNFKPSVGVGLRLKLVKEENLNLRFDYGVGRNSNNYYFDIAEAF